MSKPNVPIPTKNAPAAVGAAAGAENDTLTNQIRSSSLTTIDPKAACRHCTVPTDGSDVCTFCASYTPPACPHSHPLDCDCPCPALDAVVAPALLDEADELAAVLPTLLASRLASASQNFPGPESSRVYVQSSGPRITVAVTERDPESRQYVTREFVAELREVV